MLNICRTCMGHEEEMIEIFNQSRSPSINDMVMAISALEFSPNDTLPSEICNTCLESLEICYYFKRKVLRCNEALQKRIQTSKLTKQQAYEEREEEAESYNVQNECIAIEDSDRENTENDHPAKFSTGNLDDLRSEGPRDKDVYNEQNECITIRDSDDENTENYNPKLPSTGNVNDPPSECPELMATDSVYDHLSESDVESLNLQLTSDSESDIDLSEECAAEEIQEVYFHYDEPEDYNFSSDGEVSLHVGPDTGNKPQNIQQNSHVKDAETSSNIGKRASKRLMRLSNLECEICGKTYSSPSNLKKHMRVHANEKPFKCQHCNKSFKWRNAQIRHNRLHTGEIPRKSHKCDVCEKTFSCPSLLLRHLRIHTGERPFKCCYCDKKFTQESGMKRHIIVLHSDEALPKRHACKVCQKICSCLSDLQKHMRVHSGERPFKCQHCIVGYKRRSHLKRHMLQLHRGEARTSSKV